MNEKTLIEALQQVDFLKGLPSGHITEIAKIARLRDFKKGDVLFDEGQKADSLHLIVSGQVLLEICAESTGCKRILTVGKGELLGWSALTDERRYVAKATITEPSRIIQVDGAQMRGICESDPQFGYEFLRRAMSALAKRLTVTWKQLAGLYVSHYVTMPVGVGAQND